MIQEGIESPAGKPAVEPTQETLAAPEAGPQASVSLKIVAVVAILAVVYVARDVLIPTVLAILLALLLRPMLRTLRRLHFPDLTSALLLVSAVAIVFAFGVVTLAGQAQSWLSQAPDMVKSVGAMVPSQWGPFDDFERTKEAVKEMAGNNPAQEPVPVEVQSNEFNIAVLGVSSHFLGTSIIVFVLSFFLLGLSESLLKQAVESRLRFGEKRNIVQLVQNVEQGVSRYLATITVINIGLGAATALAMWLLGIPNYVLWGVLAATMNYVPHVGALVCMAILFFVGAVSHESIGYGVLAAGAFAALTSLESYFVTPFVLSKSLQLSPLATFLAILFCGWMWGIAGGLMAAPLLAVFKITCDQFESLRGLRAFLSGASGHAAQPPPTSAPAITPQPSQGRPRVTNSAVLVEARS